MDEHAAHAVPMLQLTHSLLHRTRTAARRWRWPPPASMWSWCSCWYPCPLPLHARLAADALHAPQLQHGADPTIADADGSTALDAATGEVAALLADRADSFSETVVPSADDAPVDRSAEVEVLASSPELADVAMGDAEPASTNTTVLLAAATNAADAHALSSASPSAAPAAVAAAAATVSSVPVATAAQSAAETLAASASETAAASAAAADAGVDASGTAAAAAAAADAESATDAPQPAQDPHAGAGADAGARTGTGSAPGTSAPTQRASKGRRHNHRGRRGS